MDRSRRSELFWLFLVAGCIALFVARQEGHAEDYDRSGMNNLVRETQAEPTSSRSAKPAPRPLARVSNDEIITASLAPTPARRPVAETAIGADRFYVPLGSYASIDQATRRYLDVARGDPLLERDNLLRIETVSVQGDSTFHRVRMGNFGSAQAAKNACAKAGIDTSLCLVVAAR
jgi:cell division protein FtsN